MRQIAQKADLALGGIYNHFDSKEAVFKAVIAAYHPFVDVIPRLEELEAKLYREAATSTRHAYLYTRWSARAACSTSYLSN